MSRALTIFFGLLALGVLAYVCIGQHSEDIQREVAEHAKAKLIARNIDFARVSADGQHITLTGTAPNEAARSAATAAALAGYGVVAVDNQITVETLVPPPGPDATPNTPVDAPVPADSAAVAESNELAEPPPVEPIPESLQVVLEVSNRRADVVGQVLNATLSEDRSALVSEQLATALPGWQINNGIATTANVPTDLDSAVQRLLPALATTQSARLDVDVQGIRIDAKLESFAQRSTLQAQLDTFAASPAFAERNLSWMLDSPPPTMDGCQTAFDELLEADSILFTTSKAEIRPSSIPLLDKLVRVARDCDVSVDIGGHTDSRGPAEFNTYLSLERARSVRNYLIANGVDRERVRAQGYGSDKPIADNNTVNGRQRNRRIEFRVLRTES